MLCTAYNSTYSHYVACTLMNPMVCNLESNGGTFDARLIYGNGCLQRELDFDHELAGTEPVAISKNSDTAICCLLISFLVEEISQCD